MTQGAGMLALDGLGVPRWQTRPTPAFVPAIDLNQPMETAVVELSGIEPLTSSLRTRRSPN